MAEEHRRTRGTGPIPTPVTDVRLLIWLLLRLELDILLLRSPVPLSAEIRRQLIAMNFDRGGKLDGLQTVGSKKDFKK